MATSVGSLNVILSANTMRFSSGMRGATRHMSTFRMQAASTVGTLARVSAALIGIGSIGALARYVLRASGSFQELDLRLRTVMGDAGKAKKAFAETFDLFVRSPMELDPLLNARILLESFGATGPDALRSVADAAAIMKRPVQDIASAIGSLETEPLRRLGIQARKAGDEFSFSFRDKTGAALTATAHGLDAARREVLRIMSVKFGGGLEQLALTGPGVMSTFSGAAKAAAAQFGDATLNRIIPAASSMNDALIRALDTGKFRAWGESFARNVVLPVMRVPAAWRAMDVAQRDSLKSLLAAGALFLAAWKFGVLGTLVKVTAAAAVLLVGQFVAVDAKLLGSSMRAVRHAKAVALAWATTAAAIGTALAGWQIGRALNDALDFSRMLEALYLFGRSFWGYLRSLFSSAVDLARAAGLDLWRNLQAGLRGERLIDPTATITQAMRSASGSLRMVRAANDEARRLFDEQDLLMDAGRGGRSGVLQALKTRLSTAGIKETLTGLFDAAIPDSVTAFVTSLQDELAAAGITIPAALDVDTGAAGAAALAGLGSAGRGIGYAPAVERGTVAAYSAELASSLVSGFDRLARVADKQLAAAESGVSRLSEISENTSSMVGDVVEIP